MTIVKELNKNSGLISYSEAQRYTASRRLEAEKWCAENNKKLAPHVLYPRTKGFIACVRKLREAPHVKAVYDMTLAYAKGGKVFQNPPSFRQTLMQPNLDRDWRFYVHVQRHELSKLPREDHELAKWLEDRWVEKGECLERLNKRLAQNLPWEGEPSSAKLD